MSYAPTSVRSSTSADPLGHRIAARTIDASKVYGAGTSQVVALDHVSIGFHEGEFTAIMGPSAIIERTRELGLLRAIGTSRRQLRATVRLEALLVSLLGACIGSVAGVGAGLALAAALADQGIDHLVIPAGRLIAITFVAAAAGVIAAVRPAQRAARLGVLTAIATPDGRHPITATTTHERRPSCTHS